MREHNNVFSHNRSDLHAEMSLITKFEDKYGKNSRSLLRNTVLFTTLEPCPMCLCRIITAGISEVYYVADDKTGGMVHLYENLPAIWKEISNGRIYNKADCSAILEKAAFDIFAETNGLNSLL